MKKIVVDMQNFLFADSIATAFKSSDYDIAVVRAESPRDTIELCRVFKPFVLLMEVTAYTPWLLCERMKLRDEAKTVCPDCKIALIVDSNTEKQAAKDIREAKKNGIIDQFFYGSMTAESGTAIFNGGEVLTQVTSPRGEREERYLSRRLQAIRGEAGGSVTINGGTFDRVVLHSAPTPENRGKYELVVNGGFFRQSIALILTGDVYASNFDHLPMQINDAYFMRTTDKLDQCRLVLGGKMKNFYDNNWDYDIHYNDIPGATLDDAKTMMWGLVPHLISENGAVFTDVHDGNWYVRGNMRRSVENGGPTMAFQGTSLGIQGSIAKVISNAYGVKEVLLDGEPMACGERGFSAPQVDTTAESEHRVTFVMYPISPMLRVLGYSYSNDYSTGYIRMLVDDEIGYGMQLYRRMTRER